MMFTQLLLTALLWMKLHITVSGVLFNATYNQSLSNSVTATDPEVGRLLSRKFLRNRRKRYISSWDISTLLDYHNRVRSQVFPPAANMEYMVWDDQLAKSAEWWALQCVWDHGPPHTMPYVGQNLSIYTGRYRSVIDLVKSWHDEKNSFPYPNTCSRPVCSHYTQMVWAASNKMGCAVNRCPSINVNGASWKQAVFLVCNYSIKGNWVGEPPTERDGPALPAHPAMETPAAETSALPLPDPTKYTKSKFKNKSPPSHSTMSHFHSYLSLRKKNQQGVATCEMVAEEL